MTQELRRAQRRPLQEPVAVFDTMEEKVLGRIGNLSESGMLLIAAAPMQEDALYQLRFELPDGGGAIEAGAQLLWIGAANTPGQYWAGLRFLALSDAHLAALREWIGATALAD